MLIMTIKNKQLSDVTNVGSLRAGNICFLNDKLARFIKRLKIIISLSHIILLDRITVL